MGGEESALLCIIMIENGVLTKDGEDDRSTLRRSCVDKTRHHSKERN